ncbi:MAG: UDP-N-acetyl glucosamine 2-epimerase [Pyrinomonadaceae bacterium]|nr:UDP-N-acetyl glucosamine 2-epimerase [Pyrinomonadaceae bacterium]
MTALPAAARMGDLSSESMPDRQAAVSKRKRKVVAIVPRGEVMRNFVHSGCFEKIAESCELSLLTVVQDAGISNSSGQAYATQYPLDHVVERWPVRFQREILDMAHGRWIWSAAARERWRIRDREARSIRDKTFRWLKKIIAAPFSNPIGLKILSRSERLSSRMFMSSDRYAELFRSIRPSLVFNGSHIHSAIATPAVQAAQWLGIPTATFIFSWDNLTSQGRILLPYDYFLVWNEELKRQLLEMYPWIKPENVYVTGSPQFDFHFRPEFYLSREQFCEEIGADPGRPIVLYSTGMANHMPSEPEIVESIADLLLEYSEEQRPQLLVRVYAKDLTGRFDELRERRRDVLFQRVRWNAEWLTPTPEDSFGLVNALRHASVGINIASTISLELCMFDKPVINVGFDAPGQNDLELRNALFYSYEHYRPLVESGAVQVAYSIEEMRTLLRDALRVPQKAQNERRQLIDRMFGQTLDGQAAHRIAAKLIDLAGTQIQASHG